MKKFLSVTILSLCLTLNFTSASTKPFSEPTKDTKVQNQEKAPAINNYNMLYRAEGEHKCWASKYAGYTCTVEGQNFTDCQDAFYSLKNRSCCKDMYLNNERLADGVSIEFRITKCPKWF